MASLYFFIGVLLLGWCESKLPDDITQCRAGDTKCLATTITDILHRFPNGHLGLGLPPFEPAYIKELAISKAQKGTPISLDLTFYDANIFGMSKTIITQVVGFEKDANNSKYEIYLKLPSLQIKGRYVAKGQVLLLPVLGNGTADIQLKNLTTGLKVKPKFLNRDGKTFIAIEKMKIKSTPELMIVNMKNLFNGNEEISNAMNKVINENWMDVYSELETGIINGYREVIKDMISKVFNTITFDDFYVKEK